MNRIDKKFRELKHQKRKALIVYITAGDPSLKKTEELVLAFEKEGVDLIELGVPFSDPLADGPTIQDASNRALKHHTNLKQILDLVKRLRKKTQIPLLFMSYVNPILHMGLSNFAKKAKWAGLDGLIIPDLPPDEGAEFGRVMQKEGLQVVYLLAPTSSQERRKLVARHSKGFVYYVSLTGVTGTRSSLPAEVSKNIKLAKKITKLPICVGFGISTPEEARQIAKISDGVIVGSAIVKALASHSKLNSALFAKKFIQPFSKALLKGEKFNA